MFRVCEIQVRRVVCCVRRASFLLAMATQHVLIVPWDLIRLASMRVLAHCVHLDMPHLYVVKGETCGSWCC